MNSKQTQAKLYRMIRARQPVIAVQSYETARVLDSIIGIIDADAERTGDRKELFVWSVTQGLRRMGTKAGELYDMDAPKNPPALRAEDEAEALPMLIVEEFGDAEDEPALNCIFVIKDMHPFLGNPLVARGIRDLAEVLTGRRQTVIMVSPSFSLPGDLRKDVAMIDWPLPDAEELDAHIDDFLFRVQRESALNGDKASLVQALQGLSKQEADAVLASAVIEHGELDARAIKFCLEQKAGIIRESGALEYYPADVSKGDVGGLDMLKQWLDSAGLSNSPQAREFGIEPARGTLVVGVPGCGKSLTAKMVSAMWNQPLLRLDVGALFGSLVGESEEQARNALKIASAVAPCILWIDEIEKALGSGGGESDGGTSKRVLGTILTWMEEQGNGVFIFATANDITSLRPELVRRFSEVFFVDLPGEAEREEIISIHLMKVNRKPDDFDLSAVVKATNDFTGAELEKVVQSALWVAFKEGHEVNTDDLLQAAGDTVPLSVTMADGIKAMRTWSTKAKPASSKQETGRKAKTVRGLALEL